MDIDFGVLNNGHLMMVSKPPLPHVVKRVEYYRDQRLIMLVYHPNDSDHNNDLIEYEIPLSMAHNIEQAPDVLIYSMFPDHDPIGYKAPLIKIGGLV